jgi:phosphatidylinositol alpha-1,6-mannosyltransferase
MNILFVSRAFPPIIGGIEKQNAEVAEFLGKKAPLTLIANTKGKSFLPIFLPWAMLQIFWKAGNHDVLLLGDGVLAPLGAIVKFFFPKLTVVSIVHGLDLTFGKQSGLFARVYQWINIPSLRKLDGLICVSKNTKAIAETLGVKSERIFVIPNGVDPSFFNETHTRAELEKLLGRDLSQEKVILRLGRFVKHKGAEWFIRNVMPKLPEHIILVTAGGVAKSAHPGDSNIFLLCEQAVRELGLEKRVILLPNVPWSTVKLLLSTADVAVAPNIPVPGSAEGFGIAVIEASLNRLPIVTSRLEGLQEALVDGENGLFAESENAADFVEKISWLLADDTQRKEFGEKARAYTLEHYSWEHLSQKYFDTLKTLSVNSSHS